MRTSASLGTFEILDGVWFISDNMTVISLLFYNINPQIVFIFGWCH